MKKFTNIEKNNGELAVRDMSAKAIDFYSNTDLISVIEYSEYDDDTDSRITKYAINDEGRIIDNLTFEQAEKYLEDMADAYAEY